MFLIIAQDNGVHLLHEDSKLRRCAACGMLLSKWGEPLCPAPPLHTQFDLSYSYDGILVATSRFQETYDEQGLEGLLFSPIAPGYLSVTASNVVHFDTQRRQTRLENRCHKCGRYAAIAGATPVFLLPGGTLPAPDAFARTDVEFGTQDEQHPVLICGDGVEAKLRKAKLRGVLFQRVRE